MWRLCIEDDESNRTIVNLVKKQYTIGRTEDNAVRLTERNVSRQHAVLERRDDRWFLRDLGSYNGSFVDGQRIQAEVSLDHASELRVGDYHIVLIDAERETETVDQADPTRVSSSNLDEGAFDRLVVVEGPGVGEQYPLRGDSILVGRGEECQLELNDTSVSRVHALLERDEQGRLHIIDRNSSNGVRVNGMETDRIPLYAGDLIELGDVQLQFVPKDTVFDASGLGTRAAFTSKTRAEAPRRRRWLGVAGAGVLALAGLYAVQARPTRVEPSSERSRAALQLLDEADQAARGGDLERSHQLLGEIAATSTLRDNSLFLTLEARWADHQFELAERSDDPREQRWLLRRVAQAPSVDSLRRQRARQWLQTLEVAETTPAALDAGADAASPATQTASSTTAAESELAAKQPARAERATPPAPKPATKPAPAKPAAAARPVRTAAAQAPPASKPAAEPAVPDAPSAAAPKSPQPPARPSPSEAAGSRPAPPAPSSPPTPTAVPTRAPNAPPVNRYPILPARLLPPDTSTP